MRPSPRQISSPASVAAPAVPIRVIDGVIDTAADYAVQPGDDSKLIRCDTAGGGFTVTLPLVADPALVPDQWNVLICNLNFGDVVKIVPQGGDTINGGGSMILDSLNATAWFARTSSTGTDWAMIGCCGNVHP